MPSAASRAIWRCALFHAPARPRSAAGAARRRQHIAESARRATSRATRSSALRQGLAAGDMGAIEPAGLPAVRLDALRGCARATACPTTTWRACSAPILIDPRAPNAFGRDAAARLHAGTVRRPHPCDRGAEPDRPAGRAKRCAPRSTAAAWASCPTCMPGFGLAKSAADVFDRKSESRRPDPRQARHLHLRRRARAKPTSA